MDGTVHMLPEGVKCETCVHCEAGCASSPDSPVRDCQDYEEKLGDILKRMPFKDAHDDPLCKECLLSPECALKGPYESTEITNDGTKRCSYFAPMSKTVEKPKDDKVNHPSHYTQGGIECIKCIEASMKPEGFQDYCKGNVIKYIHRWREKGGVEDLKKAEVYLKWLIESAENGRIA